MTFVEFLSDYQTLVGWLLSGLFLFFMLYMKSKFTPRHEHDRLKDDFEKAVSRIKDVEVKIKHMPDESALNALSLQITRLEGDLRSIQPRFERLDALLERLQSQTDRMEDFLKTNRRG